LNEVVIRAPATIANFGPGFDIFALALAYPYDIIKLKLNNTSSLHVRIKGMTDDIPCEPEKNTAGLAALHFLKEIQSQAGVDIEIIKRMPPCAGLGTSAASAVASVYGLNKLLDINLTNNEIIEIARQGEKASGGAAHADNVTACLLGGFVFVQSYSPIDVQKIDVPEIPFVICVMKKPQTTTRGFIPETFKLDSVKEQMGLCSSLIQSILRGDIKKIGQAINKDLISEPVRSRFIPGYDELKKRVLEAGAYGCNICGGGSSIFVVCDEGNMEKVSRVMSDLCDSKGIMKEIIKTKASNTGLVEINEFKTDC